MRGHLSKDIVNKIKNKLPQIDKKFPMLTFFGPGTHLYDLTKSKQINVALICLGDAGKMLEKAIM
nr:hypothetical protein [Candidatus Cloacimonadota bacterium]